MTVYFWLPATAPPKVPAGYRPVTVPSFGPSAVEMTTSVRCGAWPGGR